MKLRQLLSLAMLSVAVTVSPLSAQEAVEQRPRNSTSSSIFDLIPTDSVTEHVLKTNSGDVPYTATAGTLDLFGQSGNISAKSPFDNFSGLFV